jgi:hypothetical protein
MSCRYLSICSLLITIIILSLSSSVVLSNSVQFKGNLLFKEYGANYLNQDLIVLSRRLETADLQVYAQTYQDSSNIYVTFCESIKRLFYKTNPHIETPQEYKDDQNFSIIVSPTKHPITQAAAVCRTLGARLPEIRTRSEDRDLLQAALHHKTDTILAGASFDMKSQKFVWDSDLQELATHNVYNPPYYGGTWTHKWHPADNWYDRNLLYQAHDYYMTYVRAKDGMAFRLSDSHTLTLSEYIICQKPIPDEQIDQDDSTNVLIQMTMGICNRDLQSVVETTKQAIDQIELITSLKLNISEKSNTLDGFLPNFQTARPKRSITFSSSSSFSSSNFSATSSPSTGIENSTFFQNLTSPLPPIKEFFTNNDTCRRLSDALAFWCPLWTENEFRVKTKLIPSLGFKRYFPFRTDLSLLVLFTNQKPNLCLFSFMARRRTIKKKYCRLFILLCPHLYVLG